MPKVGTGYVEIKPDFSAFGATFGREVEARLKDVGSNATAKIGDDLKKALGEHRKVHVDVDVDRNRLSRLGGEITAGIAGSLQGLSATLSGVLGGIPGIGGIFRGLSSSFGTSALGAAAASTAILGLVGVLAALAASLGAAIAGLGALTIAFGAALGPAVLVAFAALARFVAIVKAVKDHNDNASTSARGVAAAQEQLAAASDAVANAQRNVREQGVAAYQAWAASIENVKDDLLGVKDAQQGIVDANLTTREAQQALVDYQKELHASGNAFDQVFKKFSDVHVDTSGLKSALLGAASTAGVTLTDDQELKLERLVNNVRDAKLGEAHATDTLKDSKRKLNEDTKTEVDFAHRGIAAYKPYREALQQVTTANRSMASAQRAQAAASERQTKAWDNLSPAEKKFGTVLIALGKTLSAVFNPVMEALLGGVTRGLQSFTAAATDPKIGTALTATGRALGDAFASIAKTLTSPEVRDAFVAFANAGVRIISTFGTKVFEDLALILTRIATATLPLLIPLLDKVAAFFDGLEHSSRNRKNLQDDIRHLVDVFKDWANLIGATAKALLAIGKVLEPIGTGIVRFLTHPLRELGNVIGGSKDDVRAFAAVFAPLQRVVRTNVRGLVDIFRGGALIVRGIARVLGGALTGNFREMWTGIKDIFRGGVRNAKGVLEVAVAPFKAIGKRLGEGIINALISAVNLGIRALNKVLGPHDLGPLGSTPDLRIGEIDKIGEKSGVTLKNRAPSSAPASKGDAGRFKPRGLQNAFIQINTVGGSNPDGRIVGAQIIRSLAQTG